MGKCLEIKLNFRRRFESENVSINCENTDKLDEFIHPENLRPGDCIEIFPYVSPDKNGKYQ